MVFIGSQSKYTRIPAAAKCTLLTKVRLIRERAHIMRPDSFSHMSCHDYQLHPSFLYFQGNAPAGSGFSLSLFCPPTASKVD